MGPQRKGSASIFVFGDFELDTKLFQLRRRGRAIRIEPKAFDLVHYLIENGDRIVSKSELLEKLWLGETVSESALAYCVKAARRAVGDDGSRQQVIQTVQRRGFRFVAAVKRVEEGPAAVDSDGGPRMTGHGVRIFVGRRREIEALEAALDDAVQGRGRVVLLAGEAGIGKTRMAEEIALIALRRGIRVLTGRCHEGGGAPALWPWVQIVRAFRAGGDPAADLSGTPSLEEIARILQEAHPESGVATASSPEQARFRFFDGFSMFLRATAARQPLLLVLDDLHWGDEPSLRLLSFIAGEVAGAGILLVGTYRDVQFGRAHPLTRTLAELARVDVCSRLPLTGLSASEVAEFVRQAVELDPPDALVRAVYDETEGNPFFMTEVMQLLLRDPRLRQPGKIDAWSLTMPASVCDAIGRRLDALSRECNRTLSLAAVIGRELDLDVLAAARNGTPRIGKRGDRVALPALLDEAVAARIIEPTSRSGASYRFSHALIRETLYENLASAERMRFHHAVGSGIERLNRARLDPHFDELAHHFCQAAVAGDAGKAVYYSLRAGDRAHRLFAYAEAAEHYERALRFLPRAKSKRSERCEALLGLGETRWRGGNVTGAKEAFQEAADLARQLGSADLFARAALGYGGGFRGFDVGLVEHSLVNLLEDARAGLDGKDSAVHARVLGRLAVSLFNQPGSRERRLSLSREAVEMARRVGDTDAHLGALYSRHWAIWDAENLEECLATATEMARLSDKVGDREMAMHAHRFRLVDLMELGDIPGVDLELSECTRLAQELRQPYYRWYAATLRSMRTFVDGRLQDYEAQAHEGLFIGQQVQSENVLQTFGIQMFFLRREQGRLGELAGSMEELAERYPATAGYRCALAWMYADLGRQAEARTVFDKLASRGFTDLPRDTFWLLGIGFLADACAYLGDAENAAVLYDLLRPFPDRNPISGMGSACTGPISRQLGRLAATMERWEDAARRFESALDFCRRMGAPHFGAHARRDYAEALRRRNRPEDMAYAAELLADALATYERLGMPGFAEKASTLLAPTQVPRRKRAEVTPIRGRR